MALVNSGDFQHILRILNTNIDGRVKVMYALTSIKGIGRRFSSIVLKKSNINLNKRAGELTPEEVDTLVAVISNPLAYNIPEWFLNRQKDIHTGKFKQIVANNLQASLREDINDLKKMRAHRGYRHHWGVRVRGQHTKTTGRHGKIVGVAGK
ncbi:hypothetical protein WA158_000681 [Blastocystis sp. Blastoise]